MGLKATCFGAHHVVSEAVNRDGIERVLSDGAVLHDGTQATDIETGVDDGYEAGANVGAVAISDCFDKEFAEGARLAGVLELELAQHVEDLATE